MLRVPLFSIFTFKTHMIVSDKHCLKFKENDVLYQLSTPVKLSLYLIFKKTTFWQQITSLYIYNIVQSLVKP